MGKISRTLLISFVVTLTLIIAPWSVDTVAEVGEDKKIGAQSNLIRQKRSRSNNNNGYDDNNDNDGGNRGGGVNQKMTKPFKEFADENNAKISAQTDDMWENKAARGRLIEGRGDLVEERGRGNGAKITDMNNKAVIKALNGMMKAQERLGGGGGGGSDDDGDNENNGGKMKGGRRRGNNNNNNQDN